MTSLRRLWARIASDFLSPAGAPDRRAALAVAALALVGAAAVWLARPAPVVPDYTLAAVRSGDAAVPRMFSRSLPGPELDDAEPAARKRLFIKTLLPLVLQANGAIARERARLLRIRAKTAAGKRLTRRDRRFLADLAERYGAEPDDFATLERRVDTVPPSLALAQAAIETGWGTSRFARDANALFGVWTWNDAKGLIPEARAEGARHAVHRYDTLAASVAHYMLNLNTHWAYKALRGARAETRAETGALDGRRLVPALAVYAETRARYTKLIRKVMAAERLWEFDRARLAAGDSLLERLRPGS